MPQLEQTGVAPYNTGICQPTGFAGFVVVPQAMQGQAINLLLPAVPSQALTHTSGFRTPSTTTWALASNVNSLQIDIPKDFRIPSSISTQGEVKFVLGNVSPSLGVSGFVIFPGRKHDQGSVTFVQSDITTQSVTVGGFVTSLSISQKAGHIGGSSESIALTSAAFAQGISTDTDEKPTVASVFVSLCKKLYQGAVNSNATTLEIADSADVERILQIYKVPNKSSVRTFLVAHQFLVPLIIDASFAIGKHFPAVPMELHVISDIEAANSEKLYLAIDAPGKYREKQNAFSMFEDCWWFKSMVRGRGKLAIDLS